MALGLQPRNNEFSCLHDAFVHSYHAGLLEPAAEEIVHHLPDSFPVHSIRQLCSMLKTELHINCVPVIPVDERLIHLFANPETRDDEGFATAHAEFFSSDDLESYIESHNHMLWIGFIAFKGIECSPFSDEPDNYHVPISIRNLEKVEGR